MTSDTRGRDERFITAASAATTARDALLDWVRFVVPRYDFSGTGTLVLDRVGTHHGQIRGGAFQWIQDNYLWGRVDEFRIYARALTSEEVAALYTRGPDAP